MKNWKTNLIGLALIVTGIIVFVKTGDYTQPAICITMGAGFFLSKDYNVTGK